MKKSFVDCVLKAISFVNKNFIFICMFGLCFVANHLYFEASQAVVNPLDSSDPYIRAIGYGCIIAAYVMLFLVWLSFKVLFILFDKLFSSVNSPDSSGEK